jgi:RimJ/RimL family protein N-acetyltransferase
VRTEGQRVNSRQRPAHKSGDKRVINTERLVLRPPVAEDFEGWAAFSSDPKTMLYLGGTQVREVAWRAFATMAGCWALSGFGMFSVIERRSGQWIGRVGPWRPEGWPGNEVGWGLRSEFEGQGYAYEAAVAAIDWAFDFLGWDSIIHCIPEVNLRSRVLAERLGSICQRQVVLPPPAGTPVWIWGQTREQWRSVPHTAAAPRAAPLLAAAPRPRRRAQSR